MISGDVNSQFWKNKKIFLTGHTGFKGGWLSFWLQSMGARVYGYALKPNTDPSIYDVLGLADLIEYSQIADIRNLSAVKLAINKFSPDIVVHMAAQPLVRYSYEHPLETYEVNVMGTANVLESIRSCPTVKSVIIVTTDKCYENKEWVWGYRENEAMGGYDPYSSSKACAELITSAYRRSFFSDISNQVGISTVRAGNVIGGGDWSKDRLIPDSLRAFESGNNLKIRNPMSIRPWQHVLEPLHGYLLLAQAMYENKLDFAGAWNFGPDDMDARSVSDLLNILTESRLKNETWCVDEGVQPHEARLLKLDCSKAKSELNWRPRWSLEKAVKMITQWHDSFNKENDMREITLNQIVEYQKS